MISTAIRAVRAATVRPRVTPGLVVLAGLALLFAWDLSGWDLPLAALAGSPEGFPLRENWLLATVLHDGARRLSWLCALGLSLAVWWPVGPLAQLPTGHRLQLAASTLVAAFAVSLVKGISATSCPWDLASFGGVAHYVSHWSLLPDGGAGHCFPAGHASSGFAFVTGWFAFRERDPRLARRWLAAAIGVGLVLGLAQQLRGAHFVSHTLWTAWICWTVAWTFDRLYGRMAARTAVREM